MLDQVIDTLSCIGLSLALDKCKFIVSPDLGHSPLGVRNIVIPRSTLFSSWEYLLALVFPALRTEVWVGKVKQAGHACTRPLRSRVRLNRRCLQTKTCRNM